MTLLRRFGLTLAATALAIDLGGAAAMASCAALDLAEQVKGADIIAVGVVTETRQSFAPAGGVIHFRAERLLKGSLSSEIEVYLGPSHGGAVTSVDYAAAVQGERHTLYLRAVEGGAYETNACSGSHPGEPTADELRVLGAGTAVSVAPSAPSLPILPLAAAALLGSAAIAFVLRRRPRRV